MHRQANRNLDDTITSIFKMNLLGMVSKVRVRYYLATRLIAMFITLSLCPFRKKSSRAIKIPSIAEQV